MKVKARKKTKRLLEQQPPIKSQYQFKYLKLYFIIIKQINMSKLAIAFALMQAVSFVEGSRNLQQEGFCDRWNSCQPDQQCWNSHCYPLICDSNQVCASGFQCSEGKCYPLTQPENNGQFCDQWTSCSEQEQCIDKKCVPLNCQRDVNCPVGLVCSNKKCMSPVQNQPSGQYCDSWTPCQIKDQCVDRKCVPFICKISPECAPNYTCSSGFCIQVNNSHTTGRYCDQKNECDILHVCKQNQCVAK